MSEVGNRFVIGDAIARARLAWISETSRRLADQGYRDFRRSDTAVLRRLRAGPAALVDLAGALQVSRQATRKIVASLEERGHVVLSSDPSDARRTQVALTRRGARYARAVVDVAAALNSEVRDSVSERDLAATTRVLADLATRWRVGETSR